MAPTHTRRFACQHVNVSAGKVTIGVLVRTESERLACGRNTCHRLCCTAAMTDVKSHTAERQPVNCDSFAAHLELRALCLSEH